MYQVTTIEEMPRGLTDYTTDGKCSGCGSCCSNYLPVSEADLRRIKRYVAAHNVRPQRKVFPLAAPAIDATCPFRDEHAGKCLIYEARPTICRVFSCCWHPTPDDARKMRGAAVVDMRQAIFGIRQPGSELVMERTMREAQRMAEAGSFRNNSNKRSGA